MNHKENYCYVKDGYKVPGDFGYKPDWFIEEEIRGHAIVMAEDYLNAKRNMLPSTVSYVYRNTYNYLMTVIKRYV